MRRLADRRARGVIVIPVEISADDLDALARFVPDADLDHGNEGIAAAVSAALRLIKKNLYA
jgi:hypothetical protein